MTQPHDPSPSTPRRLTRALVDRLPARCAERGPVRVKSLALEEYQAIARGILRALPQDQGLWVFAAGSLIWNPRMVVAERRTAYVQGWRRAFCIQDRRRRGSPSRPGLMMAMAEGGACRGVALRMDPGDDAEAALVSLLQKEPPVPPPLVTAETDQGPVQAIVFAVDASYPIYCPEPTMPQLADLQARAVGYGGTMAEYLLNTVIELEKVGIHDPHLWELQDQVAERLLRLT
jgi:cation transport protein ChaC